MSMAREPIQNSMGRTLLGGMLVALDSFAGLTACAGGAALAAGLDAFPLAWLAGTPFASYVAPGLILTGVGGIAAAAAATVLLHPRLGALASTIAGGVLLGWIVGEMLLLRQPTTPTWTEAVYLGVGLAMAVLGLTLYASPLHLED